MDSHNTNKLWKAFNTCASTLTCCGAITGLMTIGMSGALVIAGGDPAFAAALTQVAAGAFGIGTIGALAYYATERKANGPSPVRRWMVEDDPALRPSPHSVRPQSSLEGVGQ